MTENNNHYIVQEDLGEIRYLSIMHMKDTMIQYILGIVLFYVFMDLVPAVLGFFVPRSYFKVFIFYICSCSRRRPYAWAFILYIAIPKK